MLLKELVDAKGLNGGVFVPFPCHCILNLFGPGEGTTFSCIISLLLSCISDSDQLIIGCAQILPKIIEHEIIFNLQHKFEVVFYP
jgi:hypothetical protein